MAWVRNAFQKNRIWGHWSKEGKGVQAKSQSLPTLNLDMREGVNWNNTLSFFRPFKHNYLLIGDIATKRPFIPHPIIAYLQVLIRRSTKQNCNSMAIPFGYEGVSSEIGTMSLKAHSNLNGGRNDVRILRLSVKVQLLFIHTYLKTWPVPNL